MNFRSTCIYLCLSLLACVASTGALAKDTALDAILQQAFSAGELSGLHGVLIIHQGEVLAESYFDGADQCWGEPLGVRKHGPDTLHDLRSVTKSVVGLLYGIALAEGKVPGLDESLIEQFPQYADLADDPKRQAIRVRDALSMKMGIQWNEDLPYSNPKNSEIAMEDAPDRYRFVLDRPMVGEPGDWWTYNGGAVALVAKLIADGTGIPIDKYADEKLFKPLGITQFDWVAGRDGTPSAASGLRLNIRDLVKIGQLVLNNGEFDGKQIVPSEWLDVSFIPHSNLKSGLRYGYLWWLAPWGDPPSWVAGFGNGGQRLTVQADFGLIIAVLAGNYNQPDAWKVPVKTIEEFMVPALKAKREKK